MHYVFQHCGKISQCNDGRPVKNPTSMYGTMQFMSFPVLHNSYSYKLSAFLKFPSIQK
jgi:hypothetical protein